MIEYLNDRPIIDSFGNCYGFNSPTNSEIMEKVNELIEVVNKLLEQK